MPCRPSLRVEDDDCREDSTSRADGISSHGSDRRTDRTFDTLLSSGDHIPDKLIEQEVESRKRQVQVLRELLTTSNEQSVH